MATAFIAGYTLSNNTSVRRMSNVVSRMSDSGVLRFANLGAQSYYMIGATITQLTEAQKETLVDWLVTNEITEIALPVVGETYNGYIDPQAGVSAFISSGSNHLWDVSFGFYGVKQ